MTEALDPLEARRQLGLGLKKIRTTSGFTLDSAAARLSRSEGWLSKVEKGESKITPGEVEVLVAFYRVTDADVVEALRALATGAGPSRSSARYRLYSDVIDAGFDPLLRAEALAVEIRWWEGDVVPALLQTSEYAHAVIAAGVQRQSEAETRKRVALRMSRQKILASETPPSVTCVIDEGVLHRQVGGPAVMAAQLDRLLEVSTSGATVLLLPLEAGAHPAMNGSFQLVTGPTVPSFIGEGPEVVAYQDTVFVRVYHREPDEVAVYEAIWDGLLRIALPPKESRKRLNTIRKLINSST